MIVTLTGENSFALKTELDRLTAAFTEEQGDLALERLDGEDASYARLQEALTSMPFLASKKLVILRAPSSNKEFTEKIEQVLKGIPESTDLCIVEPKLDKRSSYYKFLKKQTEFKEFPGAEGAGLVNWVIDTAKAKAGTINRADALYLIERVGSNQQNLDNELEKLSLYNPALSRETIDLLTESTPQSTIFQLLDAAFAGNKKRALELYEEQRALKVEPQQIIAMLAWQLHIMAIAKTAGTKPAATIAKDAKVSPYVVSKSQTLVRSLTLPKLKRLIQELLTIDARSKREALDLDEALQNYLLSLK